MHRLESVYTQRIDRYAERFAGRCGAFIVGNTFRATFEGKSDGGVARQNGVSGVHRDWSSGVQTRHWRPADQIAVAGTTCHGLQEALPRRCTQAHRPQWLATPGTQRTHWPR